MMMMIVYFMRNKKSRKIRMKSIEFESTKKNKNNK